MPHFVSLCAVHTVERVSLLHCAFLCFGSCAALRSFSNWFSKLSSIPQHTYLLPARRNLKTSLAIIVSFAFLIENPI